jgi:hypothetical protein
VIPS